MARRLGKARKAEFLTMSGSRDNIIINIAKKHVHGAENKKVTGKSHLPTIVKMLLWDPFIIWHFARQATSKD